MKLEYVPKQISRKDAIVVIRELKAIEQRDGLITPKAVVTQAKSSKSPLHKFFTWEDREAAAKYREVQARQLICSVLVRDSEKEDASPVRAFVNIKAESEDDKQVQGYMSMDKVLQAPPLQEQLLSYAKNQLVLWRRKFGHLQEFFGLVEEIDRVVPPADKKQKAA